MVMRRRTARKKRSSRTLGNFAGSPARKTGGWVVLVLAALVVVNLYVFVWDKQTSVGAIKREADRATPSAMVPSRALEPPAAGSAAGSAAASAPAPVGPPGVIDGKVGKSDTLGRLLKKSGLSAAEADEVIRALSGVFDFKSLRAGQTFRIERGPDGRVKAFELVVSKVQTVRAERGSDGALVGKADNSQTRIEIRAVGGRIDSSLYAAIKASGESAALVDFFVDVFAYDLDFYNDTHDGDTFRVIWFRDGYFDEQGRSVERTLLKTPLKFQRVSSGFDRARMHPVLHTVRAHLGIDYAAPTGTPVWAAASGIITHRGDGGGAGNLVMIKHDGGIETAYMHLSKFADGLKVGQRVAVKTVIGYVGATGLATGPHLHFGVRKNGAFIDPSK